MGISDICLKLGTQRTLEFALFQNQDLSIDEARGTNQQSSWSTIV